LFPVFIAFELKELFNYNFRKIMKPILIAGSLIVNFALIAYSIAIITEQRKKILSKNVFIFLTIGVTFDIIATTCMILGSSKGPFTLHGLVGYSSLLGMLIDCILIWKLKNKNGFDTPVPKNVHLFSRYAYIWWIVAYITGALIVALR